MNQGQMAFSRIMEDGSRFVLDRCIRRYDGNRGVRRFSVRDQYLAMSFAQMTFRDSLRDIEASLGSAPDRLCHLGTRGTVARSALADRGPALLHPVGCHHLLLRQLHALAPGRGIQAGGDPLQRVPSTQVRKTGCPQSGKKGDNLLHPGLASGPPGPGSGCPRSGLHRLLPTGSPERGPRDLRDPGQSRHAVGTGLLQAGGSLDGPGLRPDHPTSPGIQLPAVRTSPG
jgi:hypothetical protein